MSELTDFLLARIAEDEAVARAAMDDLVDHAAAFYDEDEDPGDWRRSWNGFGRPAWSDARGRITAHVARHDPGRVLAECEAKRRIVAEHEVSPLPTLGLLALPYADHPDYDERWRP